MSGDRAVIKKGGYSIDAVLSAPEEMRILLKDRGKLVGMNYADELVAVIPLDRADALKGRYGGDMFTCNGPGSSELMSTIVPFSYLSLNRSVKDKALGILRLMPKKIPVVEVKFRKMTITSFRSYGIPFDVAQSDFGRSVLLSEIVLVSENYQ